MWIIALIVIAAFIAIYLSILAELFISGNPSHAYNKGIRDIESSKEPLKPTDDIGYSVQIGDNKDPFDTMSKCYFITGGYKTTEKKHRNIYGQ